MRDLAAYPVIRELYLSGLGSQRIARELNARDLGNGRGREWSAGAVGAALLRLGLRAEQYGRRGKSKLLPASLNLPIEQWELGYLACALDAEGTLCWTVRTGPNKTWARHMVFVTNTDRELIDWLAAIGGRVYPKPPSPLSKLPCFVWRVVRRADVIQLLEAVSPFMKIKRTIAVEMLATLKAIPIQPQHMFHVLPQIEEAEKAGSFVTPTGQ